MKTRTNEAQQLETDYLLRIRQALAGHHAVDVSDILQSVREHIELSFAGLPDEPVTVVQMTDVLERLGPPEAYLIEGEPAAEAPPPAQLRPPALTDLPPLEFGSCFTEAVEFYRRNFFPLLLAAIIYHILSTVTLLILAGPLAGGALLMVLNAMRRPDQKVNVGDMFGMFRRFWTLLGLFFFQAILTLFGFVLLIIPGLLLTTLWLYTELFVADCNLGMIEALKASQTLATYKRFGANFLIATVVVALTNGASLVPYVGVVLAWLLTPLCWALITVAYRRQSLADAV